MAVYTIKRGLNIPISGSAAGELVNLPTPQTVAYDPREFPSMVPRLAVKPGDKVKRGSALFYSKVNPAIRFLSPASGTVQEVQLHTKTRRNAKKRDPADGRRHTLRPLRNE